MSNNYPKPIPGKLYVHLYHGRNNPEEQMDDWGFDGPKIGPLIFCHGTYAAHLKLEFEQGYEHHAKLFRLDPAFPEIPYKEDMLFHDGKYYGDFTVHIHEED